MQTEQSKTEQSKVKHRIKAEKNETKANIQNIAKLSKTKQSKTTLSRQWHHELVWVTRVS